jgi:molybdate transport system permease protein
MKTRRPTSTARALCLGAALALCLPLPARARQPSSSAPEGELLVLAAASLTDVLPHVADAWTARSGLPVRFSFAATSRLAPQAVQGAPADVFFSADRTWMDWLVERGGVDPSAVRDFLGNELVVVVPVGRPAPAGPEGLASLARLALAGENVPAGRYAEEALRATGVWDTVSDRIVRGGSVRGALEWVARGEADAGIVYATDALAQSGVEVAFAFPAGSHRPIRYPAAVLTRSTHADVARAFLDFAAGPEAARIFREAGFRPGSPQDAGAPVEPPTPTLPDTRSAIRLSLIVALLATLAGFPVAVAAGWLLARKDFVGKTLVSTLMLAPLVMPPVVTGFLLLSALGTQSPLGRWLDALGLPVPFTLVGAAVAALVVGLPLYVLSVRNAFESVDPHYEEVSWTLGVPPRRTFLRVSVPLALPGIAAGAVLAFARALGEFGATVVLAGNVEGKTRTIALAVYTLLESPAGRDATWTLVGASVALALAALFGYEALSRRQRRRLEVHGGE